MCIPGEVVGFATYTISVVLLWQLTLRHRLVKLERDVAYRPTEFHDSSKYDPVGKRLLRATMAFYLVGLAFPIGGSILGTLCL